jgi:hypothetical protein
VQQLTGRGQKHGGVGPEVLKAAVTSNGLQDQIKSYVADELAAQSVSTEYIIALIEHEQPGKKKAQGTKDDLIAAYRAGR